MFIYTGRKPQYDSNIPLLSVNVNADLLDTFGQVTISQIYKNNYSTDIEAIYCFNLDASSCVTNMVLVLNGKRLISEIKEKTKGRTTYDKAVNENKTACLLEKNIDGSYKVSLGRIRPGLDVQVELTYITNLDYSGGVAKFVLPTNISEKYTSSSSRSVKDVLASITSNLIYSSSSKYTFNFNLNYKSHNTINGIKSLTNEIQVVPISSNEVRVTSTSIPASGDFNLLIDTVVSAGVYYNTQGDTTYVAITHKIPDQSLDLLTVEKEFIFVIDRSGSMRDCMSNWSGSSGEDNHTKIELAKKGLKLFIESLPPCSLFNVYSFGSDYTALFPESVKITDKSKSLALTAIDKFDSDMGGTEIFNCLQSVLSGNTTVKATIPSKPINLSEREWKPHSSLEQEKVENVTSSSHISPEKILILLTDGQVGNQDAVVGLCEQYNYLSRVFCIGIGSDVDRSLVRNVSKASNGYSDVLVDNDDISSSVIKMLDASLKSYYKCVGVTIGESRTIEHVLYPNQSLNFFKAMSTDVFSKLTEVVVSGINGITGIQESWVVPIVPLSESPAYLRQLWANDRILAYLNDNTRNKHTTEIIKLSIENSLCSGYTSFVVVDEVESGTNSQPVITVNVPQYSDESFKLGGINKMKKSRGVSAQSFGFHNMSSAQKLGANAGMKSLSATSAPMIEKCSFNSYDDEDAEEFDGIIHQLGSILRQNKGSNMFGGFMSNFLSGPKSVSSSRQDKCERTPPTFISNMSREKSSENIEYLLTFKNIDGSFKYDENVLKIIDVSIDKFNIVVSTQGVSKEYLANVLVLAYFKSLNQSKYTMVQKILEAWLVKNKVVEISESTTQSLIQN